MGFFDFLQDPAINYAESIKLTCETIGIPINKEYVLTFGDGERLYTAIIKKQVKIPSSVRSAFIVTINDFFTPNTYNAKEIAQNLFEYNMDKVGISSRFSENKVQLNKEVFTNVFGY